MAYGISKVNGANDDFGAIGRTTQLMTLSKTNITQAELDSLVAALQETNTITGISDFVAGTTDVLYVLLEGPTVADDASDFLGVTGVAGATVATFTQGA